jgi:hypothetical protein
VRRVSQLAEATDSKTNRPAGSSWLPPLHAETTGQRTDTAGETEAHDSVARCAVDGYGRPMWVLVAGPTVVATVGDLILTTESAYDQPGRFHGDLRIGAPAAFEPLVRQWSHDISLITADDIRAARADDDEYPFPEQPAFEYFRELGVRAKCNGDPFPRLWPGPNGREVMMQWGGGGCEDLVRCVLRDPRFGESASLVELEFICGDAGSVQQRWQRG